MRARNSAGVCGPSRSAPRIARSRSRRCSISASRRRAGSRTGPPCPRVHGPHVHLLEAIERLHVGREAALGGVDARRGNGHDRIGREQGPALGNVEGQAPHRVARREDRLQRQPAQLAPLPAGEFGGDGRLAVQPLAFDDAAVLRMTGDGRAGLPMHVERPAAVVRMAVRDDDLGDGGRVHLPEIAHPRPVVVLALPSGVDDRGGLGPEHEERVRRGEPRKRLPPDGELMDARL